MSARATRRRRCGTITVLTLIAPSLACTGNPETEAPPPTAAEALLDRSIAYHDRDGTWAARTLEMDWTGTGGDGSERVAVTMTIHPDGSTFELTGRYRGRALTYRTEGDVWAATVDGATDPPDSIREAMRLTREDGFFWRSYYGFLAGLPMKLRDPGARIDSEPTATDFFDREVQALRVRYDPAVGGDTWYFYFDPGTAALIGARFYHDESANDGEFLRFEGEVGIDGLRIPRTRHWYVNADSSYLGSDTIEEVRLRP